MEHHATPAVSQAIYARSKIYLRISRLAISRDAQTGEAKVLRMGSYCMVQEHGSNFAFKKVSLTNPLDRTLPGEPKAHLDQC